MTFLIKKRIITELFIDKTAALYKVNIQIREGTNQSDWPVVLVDWGSSAIFISKGDGMRDQV